MSDSPLCRAAQQLDEDEVHFVNFHPDVLCIVICMSVMFAKPLENNRQVMRILSTGDYSAEDATLSLREAALARCISIILILSIIVIILIIVIVLIITMFIISINSPH